jgi:hypothetical protein
MPCPVCNSKIGYVDHRMCLVKLFGEDKIKSVAEWERMCGSVTIRKGKILAYLPKTETTAQGK